MFDFILKPVVGALLIGSAIVGAGIKAGMSEDDECEFCHNKADKSLGSGLLCSYHYSSFNLPQ
jgi:hypothetical protein